MREFYCLAVHLDGASGWPNGACERGKELVLALPFQRDDARHLAIGQIEGDVVELGADTKAVDAEARTAVSWRSGLVRLACHHTGLLNLGAKHQLDDVL